MKNFRERLKQEVENQILSALKDCPVQKDDQNQKETVQIVVEEAVANAVINHIWAFYDKYGDPSKRANGIASRL